MKNLILGSTIALMGFAISGSSFAEQNEAAPLGWKSVTLTSMCAPNTANKSCVVGKFQVLSNGKFRFNNDRPKESLSRWQMRRIEYAAAALMELDLATTQPTCNPVELPSWLVSEHIVLTLNNGK